MLVTIQFDKKDEQKMKELMLSTQRDYKVYYCGDLSSISEVQGEKCAICNQKIQADKNSNCQEVWILFALQTKADTLALLGSLIQTGLIKVQSTTSVREFFEPRRTKCNTCKKDAITVNKINSNLPHINFKPNIPFYNEAHSTPKDENTSVNVPTSSPADTPSFSKLTLKKEIQENRNVKKLQFSSLTGSKFTISPQLHSFLPPMDDGPLAYLLCQSTVPNQLTTEIKPKTRENEVPELQDYRQRLRTRTQDRIIRSSTVAPSYFNKDDNISLMDLAKKLRSRRTD